jgi:D-inositol-3-phosphate glycosyltransferase
LSGKRFLRRELVAIKAVALTNAAIGKTYIVLSEHLADVVGRPCLHRRIHICPVYGVDTSTFSPSDEPRPAIRKRLGLPLTGSIIFFSSRIAPEKDVVTMLGALRQLRQRGRDIWLLNASGGHADFLACAKAVGVADRVIALPAADPRDGLAAYYRAADICVQASRAEGLGFSPLEAFACGVPVVADRGRALVLSMYDQAVVFARLDALVDSMLISGPYRRTRQ